MSETKMGRPPMAFEYRGQMLTVLQLSRLAGCQFDQTMRKRLLHMTPEEAVALGPHDPSRLPKLWPYKGQMLNKHQLAALAGCTAKNMKNRLKMHGDAEIAVSIGAKRDKAPNGERKPRVLKGRNRPTIPYKGVLHTSQQLAAMAGCSDDAIRGRIKRGMTPEQAVDAGKRLARPTTAWQKTAREKFKQSLTIAAAAKPKTAKIDPDAPADFSRAKVIKCPASIDMRHTFHGTPGRWINSAECRPWAQQLGR